MEVGQMSASELAESYKAAQTAAPIVEAVTPVVTEVVAPVEKFGDNFDKFKDADEDEFAGMSSSEMAAAKAAKALEVDTAGKTPEEIAAAKLIADAAKASKSTKTKLDDNFKQGLDKLFKEQKLDPFAGAEPDSYIIPETWEDVVELMDENKKNWIESARTKDRTELYNEILAKKSPAFQFVMEQASRFDSPAEMVPLLTAVQNQEFSYSLDPTVEEDQVKIIRSTLAIQGLSPTDIEAELVDIKERGKTESRAVALKPVLDKYNQSQTQRILDEKEADENKKKEYWDGYYTTLEDDIFKAKDIDGIKIKNEHKQLIARSLIPDEEIGGLPIYTLIDDLVAKKDFKTLSKIVLMGLDEKLYDSYFVTGKISKSAEGVQRVLRQQKTSGGANEPIVETVKPNTIKKNEYGVFG